MYILGLESSCDETSCAVLQAEAPGRLFVRANVVSSQIEVHTRFGGVVPEIAARQHLQRIVSVTQQALDQAHLGLQDMAAVAVTCGPGLIGALLVGVQFAKSISFSRNLPLIGVHHLEGHLHAVFLQDKTLSTDLFPTHPYMGLLVSGGHTSLIWVPAPGVYQKIGETRDDAAGEAFDKIGKMLGLGYPAGPQIDRLSKGGNPHFLTLPKAMSTAKQRQDFSFSGLKTWMSLYLQSHGMPASNQTLSDICASVQAGIVEQLVRKTAFALQQYPATGLVLSGGVAANQSLKESLAVLCADRKLPFFVPPPRYCTDNAAMIAAAGYFRLQRGERSDWALNAQASWDLTMPFTPDESLSNRSK